MGHNRYSSNELDKDVTVGYSDLNKTNFEEEDTIVNGDEEVLVPKSKSRKILSK